MRLIDPAIAPRARRVLAAFNFDSGSDGATDLSAPLFPFSVLSFLTAADIYLPSDPDADGTIEVKETAREPGRHQVTTNVPNWASDEHTISVYFKDYEARSFPWGR